MNIKYDNLSLVKILEKYFFLFLFVLPFDVLAITPMKKIFGELYSCLYIYFVILLFFVYIWCGIKIKTGNLLSKYILFMGISVFLSFIANYQGIINNLLKSRTGLEKFFTQLMVLSFMTFAILIIFNVLNILSQGLGYDILMRKIYKFFDFMIIFMLIYCILQYINSTYFQVPIFDFFDNIIRNDDMPASYYKRIRFVCDEASWFGTYFSIIFPFVLLKIYRFPLKVSSWVYLISVICLACMTYSRTVYFLLLVQAFVFLILVYVKLKRNTKLLVASTSCFIIGFVLIFAFNYKPSDNADDSNKSFTKIISSVYNYEGSNYEGSNLARYGMANAAISMGLHNFFGVGLGQYGFNVWKYFDIKYCTWETSIWFSEFESAWPPVHNLYARIFAEFGLLGLVIFLIWVIMLVIKSFKTLQECDGEYFFGALLAILFLVGFILTGFNIDSFRIQSFIISNAFSLFIINQNSSLIEENMHKKWR